jgi:16S rRNA (cytosine1402-N4)-methyltransferase
MYAHNPVMVDQVLSCLCIDGKDLVVDCTLGEGGHAAHFLRKLKTGTLVGIEQDRVLLERAKLRLEDSGKKFELVHDNFSNLKEIIVNVVKKSVDKIFFDLGISMFHITQSGRGFSFLREEPLDMRLDQSRPLTGMEVVNRFDEKKLAEIIWAYGEERFSNRIAQRIVQERAKKEITTSLQLVDIIERAIPRKYWPKSIHPATKTFQAIRIFVNDEIEILENALRDGIECLSPGGRICVISFHSLEDRIVKSVFKELTKGCSCPPDFPVCVCGGQKVIRVLTKKPLTPDEGEIRKNPSSRSARLRCASKLENSATHSAKESMRNTA